MFFFSSHDKHFRLYNICYHVYVYILFMLLLLLFFLSVSRVVGAAAAAVWLSEALDTF